MLTNDRQKSTSMSPCLISLVWIYEALIAQSGSSKGQVPKSSLSETQRSMSVASPEEENEAPGKG